MSFCFKYIQKYTKHHHDIYVWMMNLASLYQDAHMENTWRELDFKMNMYFKQEAGDNWKDKFNVKPSVLDTYESEPSELDSNHMLQWYVWVVKCFYHGLNGPFGTISLF